MQYKCIPLAGIGRIRYKMYNCFVVVFLHAVNGILGAGSYGIAMAKHSPYISNISVAILKLQETSVLSKRVEQVCVRLVYAL